jgi:hypothetical protein
LPRSSIIISDEPLSAETNYRTEFVAVLSNHPQGGFVTRKPSDVQVARGDDWSNDGFGSFFQRGWGAQNGYQSGWGYQPGPQPNGGYQTGSQRKGAPQPGNARQRDEQYNYPWVRRHGRED